MLKHSCYLLDKENDGAISLVPVTFGHVFLRVEHRVAAVLQFFSLLTYTVRDLMGFDAGQRYRIFHCFGRLLAQFVALPLELRPCPFPRALRQQQHRHRARQAADQQFGQQGSEQASLESLGPLTSFSRLFL